MQPKVLRVARVAVLATVGVLVIGGSLVVHAPAAQAHNYLVSSTPEAGEVLTALPELFDITTNEPLLDSVGVGSFALEVRDQAGLYYGDGCVTVAGASMTSTAALGEPGEYSVIWQVVSADGHTVSEEYPFTWAPSDPAAFTASTGSASAPECGTEDGATGADGDSEGGSAEESPTTDTTTDDPQLANLSDLLWVGGAIVLVGATVGLTLVLGGRKKKN
jgi:methionine-rich copper-binding protein CopC